MQVEYNITSEHLLAAFQRAFICDDGRIYVRLPRLTLDHDLPPISFPRGISFEEALAVAGRIIPFIQAGREKELYRMNTAPAGRGDKIH
jgi:hypothetical protein